MEVLSVCSDNGGKQTTAGPTPRSFYFDGAPPVARLTLSPRAGFGEGPAGEGSSAVWPQRSSASSQRRTAASRLARPMARRSRSEERSGRDGIGPPLPRPLDLEPRDNLANPEAVGAA